MKKINVSDWHPFVVGKLFDIHPTKAYKMNNHQLFDGGNNPVVVNSAFNNGVGGYSSKETNEKKGTITFSDTVNGDTIFYHNNDFIGYPHVQGLYPIGNFKDKWNSYTLIFFTAVFRAAALLKSFNYVNKFRRDIAAEMIIKLPAIKNDKNEWEPNWQYMEQYIKNSEKKCSSMLSKIFLYCKHTNFKKLSMSNWESFELSKIFQISKCLGIKKSNIKEGNIPYVARSAENNGITNYCGNIDLINKGNSISIHAEWKDTYCAFYQDKDFVSDGMIANLVSDKLKKNSGLFISTILSKTHYGDDGLLDSLNKLKIKLPAIKNDKNEWEPNWQYMDQYIEAIKEKCKAKLSSLIGK